VKEERTKRLKSQEGYVSALGHQKNYKLGGGKYNGGSMCTREIVQSRALWGHEGRESETPVELGKG